MTVSMLSGEQGFQAKEIDKLLDWLRTEPRFDVINLPYALLLGLAEPLKRELKAPICCTLQGDDLFLDGLGEPHRQQSMELIRDARAARRRVPPGQPVLPRLHARLPRRAAREDAPGAARHQHRGLHAAAARAATAPFTVGYLARIAPEKGLHVLCEAYRRAARSAEPSGASRLVAAGYLPPEHQAYLDEIAAQDARVGPRRRVRVPRRVDRAQKIAFLQSSTCSRCRRPTRSRRACSCSRRWPPACRSCSRGAARFRRSSRRPAAA